MPAVSAEQPLFSLDGVRPGLVAEVNHNSWLPAASTLQLNHLSGVAQGLWHACRDRSFGAPVSF